MNRVHCNAPQLLMLLSINPFPAAIACTTSMILANGFTQTEL